ncbi:hypothetical protein EGW08_023836 [Elysia chlorotica]|uniref:Uncharacterized protein n=1 Tax=Elysia chlorotica TaxID=188477 RepID=A0A3S1AU64_ELYCH|nr:hypothetical protein EGW08_023836 [Elysia chlorotica]
MHKGAVSQLLPHLRNLLPLSRFTNALDLDFLNAVSKVLRIHLLLKRSKQPSTSSYGTHLRNFHSAGFINALDLDFSNASLFLLLPTPPRKEQDGEKNFVKLHIHFFCCFPLHHGKSKMARKTFSLGARARQNPQKKRWARVKAAQYQQDYRERQRLKEQLSVSPPTPAFASPPSLLKCSKQLSPSSYPTSGTSFHPPVKAAQYQQDETERGRE